MFGRVGDGGGWWVRGVEAADIFIIIINVTQLLLLLLCVSSSVRMGYGRNLLSWSLCFCCCCWS